MRTLINACLIVVMSVSLVEMSVYAAPASPASAPLGVVLQADKAQVGADVTASGATVYDGDRLQTEGGGALRAQLGGPQIYLRPDTVASVHGMPNGFSAELATGAVVVSATQGQTFQLVADGATIRPVGTQGTIAQITKINANELVLTSTRGALEVTLGDEVKTVEAGSSYRMEVEADESGPEPQGVYHTGRRRRLAMYLIIGGVAAATGVLVWRAVESPSGF